MVTFTFMSFCHSPVDICASARAGVSADRRGSECENQQENDKNPFMISDSIKLTMKGSLHICDKCTMVVAVACQGESGTVHSTSR